MAAMTTDLTEITVIGDDDTGLVARVTSLLFERGANIEDVDQAVRDGVFRMTLAVDTAEMVCTEATLRADLHELGEDLGLDVQVRFPADRETQRIAVLGTSESHCLEALFEAWTNDELGADIGVVIGNHDDLEPLAERYDVPFHDIGDENGQQNEERLLEVLAEYDVDLIVLARYMRILGPNVVFRYEDRIINVHPSLLPAFPGAEAYRQALEEGVRVAGVTAHYVTTDLDQGPIITQRAFDVPDDANLEEIKRRGQPLEADALLEAVRLHLNGDVSVHRGRTSVREGERDYQLGLPDEVDELTPDRPVDGIVDVVDDATDAESEDADRETEPEPPAN
ncbi:formyl transferase [Natronococcus jeotgali DSM 18795]|uniref:Formyl transferase n=2 Tax=Natronococcus jeotgali TaxID=413812 RepID=L9WN83_9EURY|nr:formyl transferase [Natronococcus jeotgali DSM 18795]